MEVLEHGDVVEDRGDRRAGPDERLVGDCRVAQIVAQRCEKQGEFRVLGEDAGPRLVRRDVESGEEEVRCLEDVDGVTEVVEGVALAVVVSDEEEERCKTV